jgi:hypothetical protein
LSATIVSVVVSYVALEAFIGIAMIIKYVREARREQKFGSLRRPPSSLIQMRRNPSQPLSGQSPRSG